MDANNPIIKICQEGMRAEYEGRIADARTLLTQAWEERKSDLDACIIAHYLARYQEDPQDALYWNEQALVFAIAAGGEEVQGFYPSLYLNLGHAYEVLGQKAEATRYYERAAATISNLADDRYGDVVRSAINEAYKRMGMDAEIPGLYPAQA